MAIKVRAKFVLRGQKNEDGSMSVTGNPVHSGSEENKVFNDYTSGGSIQIHIASGKPAQDSFPTDKSKEFYLDIIPCEVDHVVTEEDLANNSELATNGVKVGDTIQVPNE